MCSKHCLARNGTVALGSARFGLAGTVRAIVGVLPDQHNADGRSGQWKGKRNSGKPLQVEWYEYTFSTWAELRDGLWWQRTPIDGAGPQLFTLAHAHAGAHPETKATKTNPNRSGPVSTRTDPQPDPNRLRAYLPLLRGRSCRRGPSATPIRNVVSTAPCRLWLLALSSASVGVSLGFGCQPSVLLLLVCALLVGVLAFVSDYAYMAEAVAMPLSRLLGSGTAGVATDAEIRRECAALSLQARPPRCGPSSTCGMWNFWGEAVLMMELPKRHATARDLPFRAAGSHPWHVDAVKGSPLTAHTLTRQCGWAGAGFGLLRRALLRALAHVRLRPLPRGNNAREHMRAEARAHSFHRTESAGANPLPVPPRKPLCLDRIDCRCWRPQCLCVQPVGEATSEPLSVQLGTWEGDAELGITSVKVKARTNLRRPALCGQRAMKPST